MCPTVSACGGVSCVECVLQYQPVEGGGGILADNFAKQTVHSDIYDAATKPISDKFHIIGEKYRNATKCYKKQTS